MNREALVFITVQLGYLEKWIKFIQKAGGWILENPEIITAIFTVVLADATIKLWKSTKGLWEAATQQAEDMKMSIAEAARSAHAMEKVSESMAQNAITTKTISDRQKLATEMQLRAYLSVIIGAGLYQEKEKYIYFEVKPTLVNNGHTPAHKVTYKACAAVLPFPLPEDFILPKTEDVINGAAVLGPHQNFILNAMVRNPATSDGFYTDEEAELIKTGAAGHRLYIWGTVSYEDVFGNPRRTNFFHNVYWTPTTVINGKKLDGLFFGNYMNRHNDAT